MTVHTDTSKLVAYTAKNYPNIPGGEQRFFSDELKKIQNSITSIITTMKLLEARMNTNGLT